MSLKDEIASVVSLIKNTFMVGTVVVSMMGVVWYFTKDETKALVQDFTGMTILQADVSNIQVQLGQLRTDVDSITPPKKLVDWDPYGSFLIGKCRTGGNLCKLNIRARRTSQGIKCSAPVSTLFIRDMHREVFSVTPALGWLPIQLGPNFTNFTVEFISPDSAAKGPAQFFSINTYNNCPVGTESDPIRHSPEIDIILN